MSLMEINWHPSRKELRNFGIAALIASTVIAVLLYLLKDMGIQWALIIFVFGCVTFLSGVVYPGLTRVIYVGLTAVTMPIGLAVSFILLAIFYFLLLTPLGLLFRLIGRDTLCRKFDSTAESYWVARKPPDKLERYFRQF
ncbi:MAG: hypothetical protein ABIF19_05600 [Planctomycetota bacterium]